MLIEIILKLGKIALNDCRKSFEELVFGVTTFNIFLSANIGFWVFEKSLSIVITLGLTYLVHKLKRNYWENDMGFFPTKNIIEDLKKLIKKK